MPGQEYSLHSHSQLLEGIFREFHQGLVDRDDFLPVLGAHVHVQGLARVGLVALQFVLEFIPVHPHDHVGKHLDKTTVAIVGEARVVGLAGQALGDLVVEAQVENGVHHAGHGYGRAGAH